MAQPDSWKQKKSFPGTGAPRLGAVGFSIGNKGYAGGGLRGSVYLNDFWEYDPVTQVWTQKADFQGTGSSVGFNIGNKGYVVSGQALWEFDPSSNNWVRKADFPGLARSYAVGFSIGSKGYFGTGDELKDFWEYDLPTDQWTQKADFIGNGRTAASGFSIGTNGYIGLGYEGLISSDFPPFPVPYNRDNLRKDFYAYNPSTDSWSRKSDFGGVPRYAAVGFSIGNKGYFATGMSPLTSVNQDNRDIWQYDPLTDTWSANSSFPGNACEFAVGFSINNKAYIGTGRNDDSQNYGVYNDFYEFDPVSQSWKKIADLGASSFIDGGVRTGAAYFSIGNKGYIGTGYNGIPKTDFWEYDPFTDVWTQKADLPGTRGRTNAVGFRAGNKGHIGAGFGNTWLSDFWEYDPQTNSWVQIPSIVQRDYLTSFTIGDTGYVGLGTYRATFYNDFYRYDPVLKSWKRIANFPGGAIVTKVSFGIGNKGYVGDNVSGKFYEYDPITDAWTQKANMPVMSYSYGFSTGNKGYVCSSTSDNAFWEYDPATDSWTRRADFPGSSSGVALGIGNKGYVGLGAGTLDFWEYSPWTSNSIATNELISPLCSYNPFTIAFTAYGTFNTDNTFIAQLSDTTGSFNTHVNIGTIVSTSSGTINAAIPLGTSYGSRYRIRVMSTSPAAQTTDNGTNLTINPMPVAITKDTTLYLDTNGMAVLSPGFINDGSSAICGSISLMVDKSAFNCDNTGVNTVNLAVKDQNGNTSTASASVTIIDSLLPAISSVVLSQATQIVSNDTKIIDLTVNYEAKDNCSIESKVLSITCEESPNGEKPETEVLDEHHIRITVHSSGANDPNISNCLIEISANDPSGNNRTVNIPYPVNTASKLTAKAIPNPTTSYFNIYTYSPKTDKISIRVTDQMGRSIEKIDHVVAGQTLRLGSNYNSGIYYVQLFQGSDIFILKLIKQ